MTGPIQVNLTITLPQDIKALLEHLGIKEVAPKSTKVPDVEPAPVMPATASAKRPPPDLGQYWGGHGGFYAGILPPFERHAAKHMVVGGWSEQMQWSNCEERTGATDFLDGAYNSACLFQRMLFSEESYPAARWAARYEQLGAGKDYHLPSIGELFLAAAYTKANSPFRKGTLLLSSTQANAEEVFVVDSSSLTIHTLKKSEKSAFAHAFRWVEVES